MKGGVVDGAFTNLHIGQRIVVDVVHAHLIFDTVSTLRFHSVKESTYKSNLIPCRRIIDAGRREDVTLKA